jgi:DNA-binding transcriptional LysR family regulator
MTLDQLKALHAVVENGGFRAASEALFKSQSAISIAIRKLEEELDVTLFLRDQYRPALTDEGRALYEKARTILSHTNEFTNLAQHFSAGEEPELRLAMSSLVPVDQTLTTLRNIMDMAPATKLFLLVETLNGTMERLNDDDADIAITESFDPHSDYEYITLTRIKLVSVLSPNSPLAPRASQLTDRDFEGSVQILVRDTSRHSEKRTAGVVEGVRHWVVNDFMMKKRIIASGLGWGRMPRHMVEDEIGSGELLMLSGEGLEPIETDIKAVRKKNRPMGPVTSELWKQLQQIEWE